MNELKGVQIAKWSRFGWPTFPSPGLPPVLLYPVSSPNILKAWKAQKNDFKNGIKWMKFTFKPSIFAHKLFGLIYEHASANT